MKWDRETILAWTVALTLGAPFWIAGGVLILHMFSLCPHSLCSGDPLGPF